MRWACAVLGHRWLLPGGSAEFERVVDLCTRCGSRRVLLPYGQCLGGHPIADHFDENGASATFWGCKGPA